MQVFNNPLRKSWGSSAVKTSQYKGGLAEILKEEVMALKCWRTLECVGG